jgi:hypothetical protein
LVWHFCKKREKKQEKQAFVGLRQDIHISGRGDRIMAISGISAVSNAQSSIAAAVQEANETTATTKIEAAHGDQQAIRKLAKQQQQMQLQNPTPKPEPGVGEAVDHQA